MTGDPVVVLFFKTAEDFFCLLFPTGSPRALPLAEYMLLRRAGDTVVALSHLFLQQLPLLLRAQKKRAGDFDLYRSIENSQKSDPDPDRGPLHFWVPAPVKRFVEGNRYPGALGSLKSDQPDHGRHAR